MKSDTDRIKELREILHEANYRYYVLSSPVLSDQDFDFMMAELESLEASHPEMRDANSPTQRVGSDINTAFKQVEHRYPMLSLANTYNEGDIRTWFDQVRKGLGGEDFEVCCELKYDGLSISLTYRDGRLERAVTRGDGEKGDDVTANVRTIKTIPLVLPPGSWPREFEIRGEVLMPWRSFTRLNSRREESGGQPFANPRNAASGTLKLQSSRIVASRHLDAYLYYLLGDDLPSDSHFENLKACGEWGFKMSAGMKKVKTPEEILAFIEFWDGERKNLPFATDGIVLKVDSLRQQAKLGMTAKSPKWAIAYKYKAARERTRLLKVAYQVGRSGAVTPVAVMDAVRVAGTVVRRATLNNEDFMKNLDLHIGDWVYVEKGGEIIPKIVGVDTEHRPADARKVEFITTCPACGGKLIRYDNEAHHYCTNYMQCPPQRKGRVEHFVSREAMNIMGVGKEVVDALYNKGLVGNVADLYDLKVEDLWGDSIKRNKLGSAKKMIEAIERSREMPFHRVIYGLGIRFVGIVAAKILAAHFGSVDRLVFASEGELCGVDGIGKSLAGCISAFFREEENISIINRLIDKGLQLSVKEGDSAPRQSDILEGKMIVISGTFKLHTRDEYKQIIERHGGRWTSAISRQTSFVLVGENMGPAKKQQAGKLGIEMIDEDRFADMIGLERKPEKTGETGEQSLPFPEDGPEETPRTAVTGTEGDLFA